MDRCLCEWNIERTFQPVINGKISGNLPLFIRDQQGVRNCLKGVCQDLVK
jgi:hypothetical protein